ncbi:MAG: GP88 family protein [Opitutales bacterium]
MIKTTILTQGNAKIVKGEELGYVTKGIHFAPANLSGNEVCQWRSKGCTASCLNTAGRGQMNSIQQSRIAKTKLFFDKQIEFLHKLSKEISNSIKTSTKKGMKSVFRLNLTSDIAWESVFFNEEQPQTIFDKFPSIQFYDYTKSFKRMCSFLDKPFIKGEEKFPSNYHLTFSRSETNDKLCEMVLQMGGNVAVVFRNELPATWNGYEVVNGDENDLRFLDKKGVVVGLIEKGMAKKDLTGFVQEGSIA